MMELKTKLENINDDDNDIDYYNDERIKIYNIFNLYKDITNNINNLSLNNNELNSDDKVDGKVLNNGNSNNNKFENDSHKAIKRKFDCECRDIGIKCSHNRKEFVKVKKLTRYPKKIINKFIYIKYLESLKLIKIIL